MKRHILTLPALLFSMWASALTTEVGGTTYELNADGTATALCANRKEIESELQLPATISAGGRDYRLTALGRNCFKEFGRLTSVFVPEGVTSIGDSCFYQCSALKKVALPASLRQIGESAFENVWLTSITCKATTPPLLKDNTFAPDIVWVQDPGPTHFVGHLEPRESIDTYVPAEAVDAYKGADVWKTTANILPLASGTESAPSSNITITTGKGTISISGADCGSCIRLFNALGKPVGTGTFFTVPAGIYVLKAGGKAHKVVVR